MIKEQELKEALEGMVKQFAYQGRTKRGIPAYWTGGLSALEQSFSVLDWEDPHPCPENKCEAKGCKAWASCGTPTADGYKQLCGDHYRELGI